MRLERRSSFGWPATTAGPAPCRNGVVVHYDGSDQGLAKKTHEACRTYWKRTRRFHLTDPGHRWRDIGYSFGVCPHGIVMEGRGFGREQAAQPGGNTTWTSVTFMSGDHERPTDVQVEAFRELRAWLRGKGVAAAVSYHGRFIATSCPGSVLRGMATSGALSGPPGAEPVLPPSPAPSPAPSRPVTVPRFPGRPLTQPPVMRGDDVRAWQARMKRRGWRVDVDGAYGPASESVCRTFQKEKGLTVDGIVGPATWAAAWTAPATR